MRFRIGYGGPAGYPHGVYFPGGRPNNGGMSEIERIIHLIASMQILFGSRRGSMLVPLLLIGLAYGGWMVYQYTYSPERALAQAHRMWDSNDTKQQMAAIAKYRELLRKPDPIEPQQKWLKNRTDRTTLYRRIVVHEFRYGDKIKSSDWMIEAWNEGIRDLYIQDKETLEFWNQTVASLKLKNKRKRSRFDTIPGLN